jgi:glycosyltransferase involved in cell wall biosynthesis
MGGFEGSDHINSHGTPLHLNHSNGHWLPGALEADYARLAAFGIRTVRESIGWRLSTGSRGQTDLRHVRRIADVAQRHGIQVIWTLHHYGLPEGLCFESENLAEAFADFCNAVARVLSGSADRPTVYQPVNEISFLSWAAGCTHLMHPYAPHSPARAYDIKCQLVRTVLRGCDALWATEPQARMLHTDPLIHVAPEAPEDPALCAEASTVCLAQFQAWDMLRGDVEPGLGGAARYLDILGVNYYHANQWLHPSQERLHWHTADPRRRPLEDLLTEVWERYGRPLVISETGHVGAGRAAWLDDVACAAQRSLARGVPLEGICLYPLIDRPDWEEPARWHRSGLWDLARAPQATQGLGPAPPPARVLHAPLAHRLRHWTRVLPAPAASAPLSPHPTTRTTAMTTPMTTLIVFSHLRWDFVYQRPQQLLSRLARRQPVIFVEEPMLNASHPALERMHPCEGVEVLRPHLPGSAPGFHDDHAPALRHLLKGYLREQGIHDYWLWFYTPMALPAAADLHPRGVVYDCMDELSAFRNAPAQMIQREQGLLQMADLVFTGGHSLYEAKRHRHPHVHCFPSSVDAAHYARAAQGPVDDSAQAHIPGPRLGYFGVIDERIDLPLVAAMADARADWQVVMVGPVVKIDPATLPQRPNLHWLGQRDYADLPDLIAGWDVCLMPFALNESTRFISPTKTLEYLAAGKPVVSTPIQDVVRPYSGIVAIADSPDAFVAACKQALARTPAQQAHEAAETGRIIAGTSWDRTASAMDELMRATARDATSGAKPTVGKSRPVALPASMGSTAGRAPAPVAARV